MGNKTVHYQKGFYQANKSVRDVELRHDKARKIIGLIRQHGPAPLECRTCLDLGCASGIITSDIAPLFALTVGLEYDPLALEDAHRRHSRLFFVRGDAMRIPLADASVEVIICNQVYEHVPDMDRMFAEISRVLSDQGCVLLSGPNWLFPLEPHYKLPFLHWLPRRVANWVLKATRRGDEYYENLQTRGGLESRLSMFRITDVMADAALLTLKTDPARRLASRLPPFLWHLLSYVTPTHNWILQKPSS